jgi:hypothetical protein
MIFLVLLALLTEPPRQETPVCVNYDPTTLLVSQSTSAEWQLQSAHAVLGLFRTAADASKGLELARHFTRECSLGRRGSGHWLEVWYPTVSTLALPFREDCVPYNPKNLSLYQSGSGIWTVGETFASGRQSAMASFDSEQAAKVALRWAQEHSLQCFVGRDIQSLSDRSGHVLVYWKADK